MSETTETRTLHEHLRDEAGVSRTGVVHTWVEVRFHFEGRQWAKVVTGEKLAGIQKAIEKPWRERVAALEESRYKWRQFAAKQVQEKDALKARADAIVRDARVLRAHMVNFGEVSELEEIARAVERSIAAYDAAYDAADRAGETPFDWKKFQDSLTGEPTWKDAADLGRKSIENFQRENREERDVAPSPTDAATEGDTRVDTLERQVEELHRLRSSDSEFWRGLNNRHAQRIDALEQRLDAPRGPEVVTDEMVQAYWDATGHRGDEVFPTSHLGRQIRAGLEAVFALRARGAK